MASPLWMKSQRILFIIVWNVAGELHSPKNMMVGSNSPQLVRNAAFHSSHSLIRMLLNPHWRSSTVNSAILLFDEEHRGSHGGLRWTDVAICKVLQEEVVKLLLFCRGQGECLGAREFSPR